MFSCAVFIFSSGSGFALRCVNAAQAQHIIVDVAPGMSRGCNTLWGPSRVGQEVSHIDSHISRMKKYR